MPGKKIYFEIFFFDTSKLCFQNPNNAVVQHAMIDAEINSSI